MPEGSTHQSSQRSPPDGAEEVTEDISLGALTQKLYEHLSKNLPESKEAVLESIRSVRKHLLFPTHLKIRTVL